MLSTYAYKYRDLYLNYPLVNEIATEYFLPSLAFEQDHRKVYICASNKLSTQDPRKKKLLWQAAQLGSLAALIRLRQEFHLNDQVDQYVQGMLTSSYPSQRRKAYRYLSLYHDNSFQLEAAKLGSFSSMIKLNINQLIVENYHRLSDKTKGKVHFRKTLNLSDREERREELVKSASYGNKNAYLSLVEEYFSQYHFRLIMDSEDNEMEEAAISAFTDNLDSLLYSRYLFGDITPYQQTEQLVANLIKYKSKFKSPNANIPLLTNVFQKREKRLIYTIYQIYSEANNLGSGFLNNSLILTVVTIIYQQTNGILVYNLDDLDY